MRSPPVRGFTNNSITLAEIRSKSRKKMNLLLTGGAGYIGSHTAVELINSGHSVVIVDNLCNSSSEALASIEKITGTSIPFYKLDLRDNSLYKVFEEQEIEACIHFAGLKAVGESVHHPLRYYGNNLGSTLNLLKEMEAAGCKKLIFSSSATVYGKPEQVPITEETPRGVCTNPYGWTKWMIEQMLFDLFQSDPSWSIVILRYFNPVGAHKSGLLGEKPQGIPNNLMPYITAVASGRLEKLHVYGDDYNTPDGTGIRDYIHVVDLARGHVKALGALSSNQGEKKIKIYNLGTGKGYSVLEMVRAFERVNKTKIPYVIEGRRPGDVEICYSDPSKAEYGLEEMCGYHTEG